VFEGWDGVFVEPGVNWLKDFSPAKTSIQWIFLFPPKAFSTAASMTRTEERQMSGPVAVAFYEWDDGLVGDVELAVGERDALAGGGTLTALNVGWCGHGGSFCDF